MTGWECKDKKAEFMQYVSILQGLPDTLREENPVKHDFLIFWGKWGGANVYWVIIGHFP